MHHATLIAVTQPEQDLSVEEFIVYCARVSNPANQANHATAPRLMRYLIKQGHWSPFEMVSITMEIVTTRDIARQILRHRSFSFQEFSQRYADPTEALGFYHREARLQDHANRQNSIVTDDDALGDRWITMQTEAMTNAQAMYHEALAMGIAKEQARAILPEGLTVSRLYMAGTLRSWLHYCNVRTKPDTQAEHRTIAEYAWQHIVMLCPALEGLNDTK
ncbi:MAG: FAD-dependent thymidylate synthase [Caulobacteraceae bacterium]|nr:FAD-dependent thymidylate synthase [Caulobacteraceae bacterium]